MLYSVRGKLILTTPNSAVVECGGVGFHCQTTFNTLRTLKQGSEVMLYTYLNVREDAMELFGFATKTMTSRPSHARRASARRSPSALCSN